MLCYPRPSGGVPCQPVNTVMSPSTPAPPNVPIVGRPSIHLFKKSLPRIPGRRVTRGSLEVRRHRTLHRHSQRPPRPRRLHPRWLRPRPSNSPLSVRPHRRPHRKPHRRRHLWKTTSLSQQVLGPPSMRLRHLRMLQASATCFRAFKMEMSEAWHKVSRVWLPRDSSTWES